MLVFGSLLWPEVMPSCWSLPEAKKLKEQSTCVQNAGCMMPCWCQKQEKKEKRRTSNLKK